jgi:large subunit ribosomal protein L17
MKHRVSGRKLNRPTPHRKAMLRNLVKDLLVHESIRTTEARAKETRRSAERIITLGKDGTLHARRQALAYLNAKSVVSKVFDELGPRYAARSGGYTRILKLAPRAGDNAPMARLELIREEA